MQKTKTTFEQPDGLPPFGRIGWAGFDWGSPRDEPHSADQGRVLFLGLAGSGKSSLLNSLVGWQLSQTQDETPNPGEVAATPVWMGEGVEANSVEMPLTWAEAPDWLEDFGLFCLIDLPENSASLSGYEAAPVSETLIHDLAAEADLLVYLIDGEVGIQRWDYRWLSSLKRLQKPLLVLLNKCSPLVDFVASCVADAEAKLGMAVLPLCVWERAQVIDWLVPAMVQQCPHLQAPLERILIVPRRQMAEALIRKAALFNAWASLQPLPFLDWPIQALVVRGLRVDLAQLYAHPLEALQQPEVQAVLKGDLARRYFWLQAVKVVPGLGSLVSGMLALVTTWLAGRVTVAYCEAAGEVEGLDGWPAAHQGLTTTWRLFRHLWSRWVRRKPIHSERKPQERPAVMPSNGNKLRVSKSPPQPKRLSPPSTVASPVEDSLEIAEPTPDLQNGRG